MFFALKWNTLPIGGKTKNDISGDLTGCQLVNIFTSRILRNITEVKLVGVVLQQLMWRIFTLEESAARLF
ncbi:MAG: hypothetical protein UX94_C0001G0043 [Parcubacteria group bacterium GW2011_GWA2_47_21]|nr:MAG: hypothetical protein UX94_C0001G0043 [Parcubacteria group bacterium GW2011_GWA2_47_21]